MIELFASRHPFLLAWSSFIAGVIAALPAAFACWHIFILPGLAEEMKVREQIIEGTKLVRLMAADNGKRKCIEAVMLRGKLVCLEQGGK